MGLRTHMSTLLIVAAATILAAAPARADVPADDVLALLSDADGLDPSLPAPPLIPLSPAIDAAPVPLAPLGHIAAPVPEPATIVVIAIGGLLLSTGPRFTRRRRHR